MLTVKKNKISSLSFSTGSNGGVLATETMMMMGGMTPLSSSLVESLVKDKF